MTHRHKPSNDLLCLLVLPFSYGVGGAYPLIGHRHPTTLLKIAWYTIFIWCSIHIVEPSVIFLGECSWHVPPAFQLYTLAGYPRGFGGRASLTLTICVWLLSCLDPSWLNCSIFWSLHRQIEIWFKDGRLLDTCRPVSLLPTPYTRDIY